MADSNAVDAIERIARRSLENGGAAFGQVVCDERNQSLTRGNPDEGGRESRAGLKNGIRASDAFVSQRGTFSLQQGVPLSRGGERRALAKMGLSTRKTVEEARKDLPRGVFFATRCSDLET